MSRLLPLLACVLSMPASAACVKDSPDCACFDDRATWNPPTGPILDVAFSTMGIRDSCRDSNGDGVNDNNGGGQPFWMMQVGHVASWQAQVSADMNPTTSPDWNRQAWCSEAVSFWHREAPQPYAGGYETAWHPTWQIKGNRSLRSWYQTEERIDGRGRRIDSGELDLDDLQFGVNAPCPGAYQRLVAQNSSGSWTASRHSQLIWDMVVFHDPFTGSVTDISATTIDGNVGRRVKQGYSIGSVTRATKEGPTGYQVGTGGKIDGWGIDLMLAENMEIGETVSTPICDLSRIFHASVPMTRLWDGPYPAPPESDAWVPYAAAVNDGGLVRTIDFGPPEAVDRLPSSLGTGPWSLDSGHFADERVDLEVVWPLPIPWSIGEIVVEVGPNALTQVDVAVSLDGNLQGASVSTGIDPQGGLVHLHLDQPASMDALTLALLQPVGELEILSIRLVGSDEDDVDLE